MTPTAAPTLGELAGVLEEWFDPAYAEEWDAVGLVTGDPADVVGRVLVAVDPTEAVAAEAVATGAQLLVTHHPLFLRGVHGVPATASGGRVVRTLLSQGCALLVAHTNADVARPGVSDSLLRRCGVETPGDVLRPSRPLALEGLVVHVPSDAADRVRGALTAAGAGRLGAYDACAFASDGTGTFRPGAGANPHTGAVGRLEQVAETRLELVVPRACRDAVLAALREHHPYEMPSFWIWPLEIPGGRGLGRVGDLGEPVTIAALMRRLTGALPAVPAGIKTSGDPSTRVRRIAVVGGSGSDQAAAAARAGADVLVTSDTRHHAALEAPLPVVDVAHFAGEWPWAADTAARLSDRLGPRITVDVSTLVTDAWTCHTAAEGNVR